MYQIKFVSVIMLFAFTTLWTSCGTNAKQQKDGRIYQIQIVNQDAKTNSNYALNWASGEGAKMKKARLFECQNPTFEYGHIAMAEWENFDALKTAYNNQGKPDDQLHRAYQKVDETGPGDKSGDFYVITVFDFPKSILGEDGLKPNWDMFSSWMKDKSGFVGAELYESLSPDVTYRYINVANWNNLTDLYKIIGDESNLFNETLSNSSVHAQAKSNIYKVAKLK